MSILQSQQSELRFLKRKNLEEEARVIGNYYSDLIRNYGVDCIYHKLNTKVFGNFRNIVDKNTVLRHAYGQIDNPDYSCSALMITYPEVHQDLFNMQNLGYHPQTEIDFNFDAKQFACDLATKCGQLKEYPITEDEIYRAFTAEYFEGNRMCQIEGNYKCGILKGKFRADIDTSKVDQSITTLCNPYNHSEFIVHFPKNEDLYTSLEYKIFNDDYIETMITLTYKITRILKEVNPISKKPVYEYVLSGKLKGSVLFYDINAIGKYLTMIHPEVGDIITIDFPDDANRERYEITDCYDKSLQSDGTSPLLHKYIWKCKARRYVNSYENVGELNEADERLEEKIKYEQVVEEQIAEKISLYDEGDEDVYGGYKGVIDSFDKQNPVRRAKNAHEYDYLSDGDCIDIMVFGSGSKLITNGYDLIFVEAGSEHHPGIGYLLASNSLGDSPSIARFESGLRWLKASDDKIVFVNAEGECTTLAKDEVATQGELEICLNDLNESTVDTGEINSHGENFLKFKGSRSYLWATKANLYAKLHSNNKLYRLV